MNSLVRVFAVSLALLSAGPDLFRVRETEIHADAEKAALFQALESALRKLDQSRQREGRQLASDMRLQIDSLRKTAGEIEARAAEIGTRPIKAAEAGLEPNGAPRPGRDAEASVMTFKGDINEEVVRLKSHVAALAGLVRESGSVGKRIDFLLQEVQRELNTISSKMPQLEVVKLVLAGKERVEKIREQTQNIG